MNPLEESNYKAKIEFEFDGMELWYRSRSKNSTSIYDVLQLMLDEKEKVIWWWVWQFMGRLNSKGGYLSHRACARASDLAIHHPDLVEDRRIGRYKVYRLKVENMDKVTEFLVKHEQ